MLFRSCRGRVLPKHREGAACYVFCHAARIHVSDTELYSAPQGVGCSGHLAGPAPVGDSDSGGDCDSFSYRTPALHAAFGRFLTQAVVHGGMCCGADEPGSHPYNRKGDTISVPPFRFSCWATWIRTKNDRTRICSVTITP